MKKEIILDINFFEDMTVTLLTLAQTAPVNIQAMSLHRHPQREDGEENERKSMIIKIHRLRRED